MGIARHVEGAVAGDAHGAGAVDEGGHAGFVDIAFGREAANHHAGHADLPQGVDVGEHGGEFGVRIEEVAATRADDDEEGDGGAA